MTVSQERVEVWTDEDLKSLKERINEFIKTSVSKVIYLRINTIEESGWNPNGTETRMTVHYAYMLYIPM